MDTEAQVPTTHRRRVRSVSLYLPGLAAVSLPKYMIYSTFSYALAVFSAMAGTKLCFWKNPDGVRSRVGHVTSQERKTVPFTRHRMRTWRTVTRHTHCISHTSRCLFDINTCTAERSLESTSELVTLTLELTWNLTYDRESIKQKWIAPSKSRGSLGPRFDVEAAHFTWIFPNISSNRDSFLTQNMSRFSFH